MAKIVAGYFLGKVWISAWRKVQNPILRKAVIDYKVYKPECGSWVVEVRTNIYQGADSTYVKYTNINRSSLRFTSNSNIRVD